MNLVR